MNTSINPFKFGRYEHEADPAIFLPRRYSEFATGTNYYIQGSRGTGKTAILRSLSFKDRVKATSFRVDAAQFQSERVLGLYTRVSDLQMPRFTWLSDKPEICEYLFGAYFSFMHCQLLCDALATLPARGYLPIAAEEEIRFVEAFYSIFADIVALTTPTAYRHTFSSIRDTFQQLLGQIHEIAVRPRSIEEIAGPFLQPNKDRLDRFTELLIEKVGSLHDWRFILCLDEAEVFVHWQQKIINSYVHGTKSPWSYLIAFVENSFELWETATPNQSLGVDDRIVRSLDNISRRDFIDFADGVVRLRLERAGYDGNTTTLQSLIGTVSVNDLLQQQLSDSTKREARSLLAEAKNNRSLFRVPNATKSSPIYETWLVKMDPSIAASIELFDDALENRRISSSTIRKRHLVAYHNICMHFGIQPIYAGEDAIIGLSDQCVRDLLRMLYYMFQADESIDWLTTCGSDGRHLGIQTQNGAIRQASIDKRNKMSDEVVTNFAEVESLIDNLGKMFRIYQRKKDSSLDTEHGLLRINFTKAQEDDPLFAIISEARYCGLIHAKRTKTDITVRLHAMLNPIYDLPGRRPSYHVTADLLRAKDFLLGKFDRKMAIDILHSRSSGTKDQGQLFTLPEADA
ncbi:MAG: ORC-CDC6 family AAA ATPase [Armatimonadota bacterium]